MVHINGEEHYEKVIKILTDADKPKKKKTEGQLFEKKKFLRSGGAESRGGLRVHHLQEDAERRRDDEGQGLCWRERGVSSAAALCVREAAARHGCCAQTLPKTACKHHAMAGAQQS